MFTEDEISRAALNSMSAHLAVVNEDGIIVQVNDAWERFACENGDPELKRTGLGTNYFAVCKGAVENNSEGALEAWRGILSVIQGEVSYFEMEYPCHAPERKQWFIMRVTPLRGAPFHGIVVAHFDVTFQKQVHEAESAAHSQEARTRIETEIQSLEDFRSAPPASVTARMYGGGSLREILPDAYRQFVDLYASWLDNALEQRVYHVDHHLSDRLQSMSDQLGFLNAGPRDVVEIHSAALSSRIQGATQTRKEAYLQEARLMALELMGYLVSFYKNHSLGMRKTLVHDTAAEGGEDDKRHE